MPPPSPVVLRPPCYSQGWTMIKSMTQTLFFSESPLLPLPPFELTPSFPFSLELQGWEVLEGLEEQAPTSRPLLMLSFLCPQEP